MPQNEATLSGKEYNAPLNNFQEEFSATRH
jgi:hypothetical protein